MPNGLHFDYWFWVSLKSEMNRTITSHSFVLVCGRFLMVISIWILLLRKFVKFIIIVQLFAQYSHRHSNYQKFIALKNTIIKRFLELPVLNIWWVIILWNLNQHKGLKFTINAINYHCYVMVLIKFGRVHHNTQ